MRAEPLQILLVDDDSAHVALMRRAFSPQAKKYHLLVAGTLVEARNILKKTTPALVIVDYRLPDGEGLELLPGSIDTRIVPTIILTGQGDERLAARSMKAGAMDYIVKSEETLADMLHITERSLREWKQANKRRLAEEKASALSKILEESLNEIYIFDAKTLKFIQVNYGARRNLGYEVAELAKLTPVDLKPEFSHESFEKMLEPLRTGHQEKIYFTTIHRRKDGSSYPVEVHLQLSSLDSRKVFIAIVLDVTERQQAEQSLRRLQAQTRQIIDTARDAFVSMDENGFITDWNPQAEQTFGWSRQQAIGQLLSECIIPKELCAAHEAGLKLFLATGECSILEQQLEITALHREGHEVPVELSVVAVRDHGQTSFNAFIRNLSDQVLTRQALKISLVGTIEAISKAFEVRDPYTVGHQQRVARLACSIAQEMGLDSEQIEGLGMGATIHDVGKIYLPAEILSKPTKLAVLEFELIKSHSQVGYDILKDIEFPWPIADIAYQHHERLDGSGYPQGLKGDEICLEAKITAVADVVEAMSSHRPYRPSLGIDKALEEIECHRAEKFDAAATDACLLLFREKGFTFGRTYGLSKTLTYST